MSILDRLNHEHIFGNLTYTPIRVWRTPAGEMGIYQSTDTPIAAENILIIVDCGEGYWTQVQSARALDVHVHNLEILARFASAERIYPEGSEE